MVSRLILIIYDHTQMYSTQNHYNTKNVSYTALTSGKFERTYNLIYAEKRCKMIDRVYNMVSSITLYSSLQSLIMQTFD